VIVAYHNAALKEHDGRRSRSPVAFVDAAGAVCWQSYLYVMARSEGEEFGIPSKIGISDNVGDRVKSLQTGSAFKIAAVFAFRLPSRAIAQDVERDAHRCFQKRRTVGEWYDVDPYVLVQTIESIVVCALHDRSSNTFHWWQLCDAAGCMAARMLWEWKRPHWRGEIEA
jgi:hypothetical protein